MKSTVLAVISTFVALFLGFSVSFAVSPDPTGIFPIIVGVALIGVLVPVFYSGIWRLFDSDKIPI